MKFQPLRQVTCVCAQSPAPYPSSSFSDPLGLDSGGREDVGVGQLTTLEGVGLMLSSSLRWDSPIR